MSAFDFKTMHLKAFFAGLTVAMGASLIAPEANAQFYNTQRYGGNSYTYGSDGSRMNTQSVGGTTYYNGTTGGGSSFRGQCTTIGSSTFCN